MVLNNKGRAPLLSPLALEIPYIRGSTVVVELHIHYCQVYLPTHPSARDPLQQSTMKPSAILLMWLLMCPLALCVPLSALSSTTDNRFYPGRILHFRDGTVLVSATSTYGYDELGLHPIVTVPNQPEAITETILLARVHPVNQTIIWASAVTNVETNAGLIVDTKGNTYVISDKHAALDPPEGTITVIKYSPKGVRLYERSHTPRTVSGPNSYKGPAFALGVVEDGDGSLFDVGAELVVPVLTYSKKAIHGLGILRVNKKTGAVVATKAMPKLKELKNFYTPVSDFAVLKTGKKALRSLACFLFRGVPRGKENRENLYVQCASVRGKKKIVTRLLDDSDVTFFRQNRLAVEGEVKKGRLPSLFVVHERAAGFDYGTPEGESTARHEMVIDRLDGRTLENVDWGSGKKGGRVKPLIVRLPTPRFADEAAGLIAIKYLLKRRTIGLVFSITTEITKFRKDTGPRADIVLEAKKGMYVFPPKQWVLYIDENIRFATTPVDGDPRTEEESSFRLILSDMAVSKDEKTARLFGFFSTEAITSGPLYILNSKVPNTSMH